MIGYISSILPRGRENAIPTSRLVQMAGCSSARQLQAKIAKERAAGSLILSSAGGGYFLPADGEQGRAEILAYKRTLYARAVNTIRAARAAKKALEILDGQEDLDNV